MSTGFIYHPDYLRHDTGRGHPESPARLSATMEYLQTLPWFAELSRFEPEPCEISRIERVHPADYINRVEAACRDGERHLDSMDTAISRESFAIARLAAGAPLRLADAVMTGEVHNGFALVRPPGHHAEADMALGFCLFNNVAILARYLQDRYRLNKVLILDWDVHHGNGTQHAFYNDPSVFYISTHQAPFYPGTGAAGETGAGSGTGTTLNCPLPAGSGDSDYEAVFNQKILPAIDAWQPEFIIISAGFDAHAADPLAQMELSAEFYGWMSERILEKASSYSHDRVIAVLEGGYDLHWLPRCIAEHLQLMQAWHSAGQASAAG